MMIIMRGNRTHENRLKIIKFIGGISWHASWVLTRGSKVIKQELKAFLLNSIRDKPVKNTSL